jgi:MFS transporter, SP family, galactose:H+ symporter
LYGGGGGFVALLYLLSVIWVTTTTWNRAAMEEQLLYETPTTTTRKVAPPPATTLSATTRNNNNTIHWFFFAFGIAACQQLSGINAIISYTPGIFSDAGAPNPVLSSTLTNLVNVFGTCFSGYLVDTRGRRPLLLKSLVLMTVSLFLVSLTSALIELIHDDSSTLNNVLQIAVIPLLMLYFLGFALGPGPLFYVICAETFDAEVRDRAMGVANFFLWTFNLITVTSFPFMYENVQETGTFAICGVTSAFCCVFAYFHVKETKDLDYVLSPLLG